MAWVRAAVAQLMEWLFWAVVTGGMMGFLLWCVYMR